MPKFRKRPVVIEAVQWGGSQQSWNDILAMGDIPQSPGEMGTNTFKIKTLEGDHTASKGDWIIRGIEGEYYPCKPDIFEKTYEKV